MGYVSRRGGNIGNRSWLAALALCALLRAGQAQTPDLPIQPRAGQPLAGLTPQEQARFDAGKAAFETTLTVPDGLGPIFNETHCSACHLNPIGGSGTITVTRFGHADRNGFDPLTQLGGSLLQSQSISPECAETIPDEANVTALRLTNSTLGFGLVEAIADADIQYNADYPPPGVSGRVHMVPMLENPGGGARVGRFGWKCQLATVLSFSGDASLNEMGLTNALVPTENAPNGNQELLAQCDTVPDPEDHSDAQGVTFIQRVTDFQRFLAPPPQTPKSGMTGETVFNSIGCASCHVSAFTTVDDPALEDVLRNQVLQPYSDFLLHDMGLLGDGIVQGQAQEREMRTAPLWGLRLRDPLLHDGSVIGGTFAERVTAAIAAHDTFLSEGASAGANFAALSDAQKDMLIAFLNSLGRAEFDHDGDNHIDLPHDYAATAACFTGPGSLYVPDDPCAISDIDADGDVDLRDISGFMRAFDPPPL
ncbi:MAG TPA: di-heme oxidoredictase family protein [Phycisphaerae bacterium]